MANSGKKRLRQRRRLREALVTRPKTLGDHWNPNLLATWRLAAHAYRQGWPVPETTWRRLRDEGFRLLTLRTTSPKLKIAIGEFFIIYEKMQIKCELATLKNMGLKDVSH